MPAMAPVGSWPGFGSGIDEMAAGWTGQRCGQPPSATPPWNCAASTKSIALSTAGLNWASFFSR
jgi:hypothetical protein